MALVSARYLKALILLFMISIIVLICSISILTFNVDPSDTNQIIILGNTIQSRLNRTIITTTALTNDNTLDKLMNSYDNYTINGTVYGKIYNFTGKRTPNNILYSYSIAILSMNVNKPYPSINLNLTLNRLIYARKYGYIYIEFNKFIHHKTIDSNYSSDERGKILTSKPLIISRVLNDFTDHDKIDFILWFDFDALVYNCEITIESIINIPDWLYWVNNKRNYLLNSVDYVNLIVSGDFRCIANDGIFLIHNTLWSKEFINNWIDLTVCDKINWNYIRPVAYYDNRIFIILLHGVICANANQKSVQNAMNLGHHGANNINQSFKTWKEFLSNNMKQNVAIIPQKAMNAYKRQSMKNHPVFMHFAGMKNRTQLMTDWLSRSTCNELGSVNL